MKSSSSTTTSPPPSSTTETTSRSLSSARLGQPFCTYLLTYITSESLRVKLRKNAFSFRCTSPARGHHPSYDELETNLNRCTSTPSRNRPRSSLHLLATFTATASGRLTRQWPGTALRLALRPIGTTGPQGLPGSGSAGTAVTALSLRPRAVQVVRPALRWQPQAELKLQVSSNCCLNLKMHSSY